MKSIENAIMQMDKEDAKVLKYIGEKALDCARQETTDIEQLEKVDAVIEMIITTAKERVMEITMREIESN